MYVRLASTYTDTDSGRAAGVFTAAYDLIDSDTISNEDAATIREVLRWFNRNMPPPKESDDFDRRAIYWFKGEAGELIQKLWQLAQLLRSHGLTVEMVKTTKPGYVVYEDRCQVAAIPFRDSL
jgi:hypothetical protein